ncbi:MAG: hypothetical protein ACFFD7_03600 [Candidatus Thorarchaeota archaeon]
MTNLLEKALLLGFSIFLLTVFSTILIPYLNEFAEFNKRENKELDNYMNLINKIDDAVLYVIENPKDNFIQDIEYPGNLNITFIDVFFISEFLIGGILYSKTLSYNTSFNTCYYYNISPESYLLNVSYSLPYIIVNFNKLKF